jgi:ATP-binding cassette subfamily B protein
LVLDEATSSLDPLSEQQVQSTLQWFLQQGKTVIIIAHRLSTIRHCDTILVLQKGKLVEAGYHEALLINKGPYSDLWHHHLGSVG